MRLIDADALKEMLIKERDAIPLTKAERYGFGVEFPDQHGMLMRGGINKAFRCMEQTPTIDAVPVEQYNDLREAFVDFVCSGVHNPAPYCKNKCAECVDGYGWCTYSRCNGFNPDGKRRSDD